MMQRLFHHAMDVVQENGKYRPRRFTQRQTEALAALNPWFGENSRSASGISLKCHTTAETVSFSYSLSYSVPKPSGFDVYENGVLFHNELLSGENIDEACFTYRKQTSGEALLEIVLPSAAEVQLWNLCFGAWRVCDESRKPLVLWYGDSLTQSTALTMPSMAFPALSSRLADVNFVNRGIGSLYYDESVLDESDLLHPNIIMVEFGCNDLVMHGPDKQVVYVDGEAQYCTAEDVPALMEHAHAYLCKLRRIYPNAIINVISLLWAAEECDAMRLQANAAYDTALQALVQELDMHLINGLSLMPHLEECCILDRVHLSLLGSITTAQALVRYLHPHP